MKRERNRERQSQGAQVGHPRDAEHRVAEMGRVDVLSRQEEQESEAHEVQELDRSLGLDPPETLWSDGQSEEHFEHDRRDQVARNDRGENRGDEGHGRHHQQPGEVEGHHALSPY